MSDEANAPLRVTVEMTATDRKGVIDVRAKRGIRVRARYHRIDGSPLSDGERAAFDDAAYACARRMVEGCGCVLQVPDGLALTMLAIVEDVEGAA